jgi:hypothetical protein
MTHQPDPSGWRKSSHSGSGNNCLEIAPHPTTITIRDSTNPHGPTLAITPHAWAELTHRIKAHDPALG